MKQHDRISAFIAVDALGAVSPQPDRILDGTPLIGCQAPIVSIPARGGGGDVRRKADADRFFSLRMRAGGGAPAVLIGTQQADSIGQNLLSPRVEVVSVRHRHFDRAGVRSSPQRGA